MHSRSNLKTALYLNLKWLAAYLMLLSTCLAQRVDTLLMLPNKASVQDALAYISSVENQAVLRGEFVYLARGFAGLRVYSLSDHANPRLIGEYQTDSYARTVKVDGDRIFVMGSPGLAVFDIREPAKLRRLDPSEITSEAVIHAMQSSNLEDSRGPSCVAAAVDNHLYIARDDLGVVVIDMPSPLGQAPSPPWHVTLAEPVVGPGLAVAAKPIEVPLSAIHAPAPAMQIPTSPAFADEHPAIPAESVSVAALADAPKLTARFEGGAVNLRVSGPAGQTVRVQRSSLIGGDWTDWQTITLGETPIELTDDDAAGADQIFYRAISP